MKKIFKLDLGVWIGLVGILIVVAIIVSIAMWLSLPKDYSKISEAVGGPTFVLDGVTFTLPATGWTIMEQTDNSILFSTPEGNLQLGGNPALQGRLKLKVTPARPEVVTYSQDHSDKVLTLFETKNFVSQLVQFPLCPESCRLGVVYLIRRGDVSQEFGWYDPLRDGPWSSNNVSEKELVSIMKTAKPL